MTAIVGVLCRNGLVIGSDSSVTFAAGQLRTIEQPTEKLTIVANTIIIAGTGQVGLGQRFNRVVEQAHADRVFRNHQIDVAKELTKRAIADFSSTSATKGQYGALVGFLLNQKAYLCEFSEVDMQPEFKDERVWYCSMGSAQPITDPFLALMREVFWLEGPPSVQDGIFAVTWALEHAVAVNPGGVNGPVRLAVLELNERNELRAHMLTADDLEEHRQTIAFAKSELRGIRDRFRPNAPGVPEPPRPA